MNDLPAALDLAAFEHIANGRFRPIGRLPGWWSLLVPSADQAGEYDLAGQFPILELFLPDAAAVWEEGSPPRLESDIWTEGDNHGETLYLRAVAIRVDGRPLMVLVTQPKDLFNYQQLAHDLQLQKETIERMSRELELRRREAERATRAKSDFLAVMSHEIRTPLNAIIGVADLLKASSLTAEQQKYVEVFQRNGVSLLNLINDILDLSKVEAGKIELEADEMDLRDVIGRATEVIEGRARAKGLSLSVAIEPSVPVHLVGDPNRLRQILINLLGNSIKFTERGHIEIRVSRDPELDHAGRLRFAVRDTGIGIPEDKVGMVFESFTQADTSTSRKYGGTGLGLSIAKQLVELMGGRIWVESQVGVGSTFYFTAEFLVVDFSLYVGLKESRTQAVEPEKSLSGLRILLADDSDDNRFLILSYLKGADCAIDIAENGESAAAMFRSGKYDIVLMDAEMPVMDGWTAAGEIRRFERESGLTPTPVLVVTAHALADVAEKSRQAGFTAHLTKPLRQATLLEAIARYAPTRRPGGEGDSVSGAVPVPSPASTEPTRIRVEQGMEDIVPGYLEKRRADVHRFYEALDSGNFETIRMMGHKMKGTGAAYGFELLTSLGAAIERAAQNRDAAAVRTAVVEVARFLESVQLEFSRSAP